MKKHARWTEEHLNQLKKLIDQKVSLARAAVILKRPQTSVQLQARRLGTPFPGLRKIKAALRASIREAEEKAGTPKS